MRPLNARRSWVCPQALAMFCTLLTSWIARFLSSELHDSMAHPGSGTHHVCAFLRTSFGVLLLIPGTYRGTVQEEPYSMYIPKYFMAY